MARRAFTLAELVVAAALMALLIAVLVGLLIPALRQASRIYARVEMAQFAMTATQSLARDLGTTARSGVHFGPDARLVAVQPLKDAPTGTRRAWSSDLILYLWDSERRTLNRRSWSPLPPALLPLGPEGAAPISATQLETLAQAPAPAASRLVATGLERLELQDVSGPCSALRLVCSWAHEASGHKEERFQLVRLILLRNPS